MKNLYSHSSFVILLLFLNSLCVTFSQVPQPAVGLYTHFGIAEHKFDMNILAGQKFIDDFSIKRMGEPNFNYKQGNLWDIGCLYEQPFSKALSLTCRLGYSEYSANELLVVKQLSQSSGDVKSTLDLHLKEISFDLLSSVKIYDELSIIIGGRVGYITEHGVIVMSGNSEQKRYPFTDKKTLLTSFAIGLTYNFRPFDTKSIVLSPEILLSINMTDFVRGQEWTITPYRFGLVLKYVLPE